MPRCLLSLLILFSLARPELAVAQSDRDESLILALRALNQRVRKPLRTDEAFARVQGFRKDWLEMTGASAAVLYAVSLVPVPGLQRVAWSQTMTFAKWAAVVWLGGEAVQAGIQTGSYVYRRVKGDALSMDANDYKSREGITQYFQLPINKQYLIAIGDDAFVNYILQLHESLEILNGGFAPAPPSPSAVSEGALP